MLRAFVSVLGLLVGSLPAQVQSDAPDRTPSDFVRFVSVDEGGHLDTAITTYRKDALELVLFSAVHIADAACYAALNDRFTTCDVLLYELVASPDHRPTRDREEGGFNPVSLLQKGLKNSLELTFQLDEIDYQATNFVHADMTPEEFAHSMEQHGESMLSIMLGMMSAGMQQQREQIADAEREAENNPEAANEAEAKPSPKAFDLVSAFRKGEGRHLLRMTFAQQMEQVELLAVGGNKGSTLLEGRNEKCLEVLKREMARGHKRIGIYYGAAHFPHMEQRLVQDLGFHKTGHEWLVAWDCKKRPDAKFDRDLIRARQRCLDDLGQLGKAARAFASASGRGTPPTVAQLATASEANKPLYTGPMQDPWGHDYVVRKRPTGTRWEVASAGQDGRFGSDDDLVLVEARGGGLR